MNLLFSIRTLLALAVLFSACGAKPDGTPMGVNPNKNPDGSRKDSSKLINPYGKIMPPGGEVNATTQGSSAGHVGHHGH